MPTEQNTTSEKSRRIIFIGNTTRTLVRNQYKYHWSTTKVKQKRCYCSYCGQIYQDGQAKSNNNKCFLRRNCKDLSGQNMENTWSTEKYSK